MKRYFFSLAAILLAVLPVGAQVCEPQGGICCDTLATSSGESAAIGFPDNVDRSGGEEIVVAVPDGKHRLDKRLHRGRVGWERIIPTHLKLQFAGGIGMISGGFGWDYGKLCRWETDLYFGYLPKGHADHDMVTFTLKQNYIPWSISCGDRVAVEPFYCGIYLNTVFGPEFWVKEPDRYPHGYYTFSTKVRSHIFMGQRLVIYVNGKGWVKNLTAYYEVSTCDLYLISALTNRYLSASDVISFSFGLKMQIF